MKQLESRIRSYESNRKGLYNQIKSIRNASLAIGASLLSSIPVAEAAIVYSGIQNVNLNWAGGVQVDGNIDIDGGGNDLLFRVYGYGGGPGFVAKKIGGGNMNAFSGNEIGGYVYPTPHNTSQVFDANAAWQTNGTQGDLQLSGISNTQWDALANGTTRVMGIRLSGDRYGWVRITKNSSSNWTIVDWAYEDVANTPISPTTTLPIELGGFTASTLDKGVSLEWNTLSEINNAGFEIERSTDGRKFARIGYVEGSGTSTRDRYYSYLDNELESEGAYYYRLKQMDYDGSYTFSDVLHINYRTDHAIDVSISPNPAKDRVHIEFSSHKVGAAHVSLISTTGQLIQKEAFQLGNGSQGVDFHLLSVESGVYIMKIEINSKIEYRQIVVK